MLVVFKIPPKESQGDDLAAPYSSRRIRGLSPLPFSPLVNSTRRNRSTSLSTVVQGAQALAVSPGSSPAALHRERRSSVIVYSNPNSGASTPRSGDWDHYSEQPTFWNSRFGWINQPRIELVNTESDSSIDIEHNLMQELHNIVDDSEGYKMADGQLSDHILTLKKLYGAIKAEITLFTPSDLTEAAVSLLPGHLDSVKQLYVKLSSAVDDLEDLFADQVAIIQEWKIKLNTTRDLVSSNRRELMDKKASFTLPISPTMGNVSTISIESQMSVLKMNESKSLTDSLSKADEDYQEVTAEIDLIQEDIQEHFESAEEIKLAEDSRIRVAMLESAEWKKRKQEISKLYRKYCNLVERLKKSLTAEIDADSGRADAKKELEDLIADKDDLETKFDEMELFVDSCLKELRAQDFSRSLHSKDVDKPGEVDWPRFSGKDSEDFNKFKNKLEKAFKLAKISREMKVDKLRTLISGHARDIVPDTVKDIDEAFKLLDDAFGDPSRLIDFKLKSLASMGQLPSADKKGGYKNQVSFYIKLQGIMEDLVALGSQSDDLAVLAFHRSTSHTLANRFPSTLRTKLILKHSKLKGKDQLVGMLETIKRWREEAQIMDTTEADSTTK